MEPQQSKMFVMLPKPEHVFNTDLQLVLCNFMLMKLGGQVVLSRADLSALSRDYSGYTLMYSADDESFTLVLKTRPEEFPPPEPPKLIEA